MVLVKGRGDPDGQGAQESASAVRVLVVDEHEFFRIGIATWLQARSGLECVGEADSLAAARDLLGSRQADVLLMDVGLPGGDGLRFIREVSRQRPALPIIALSQHDEAAMAERVFRNGARGYLTKSEAPERLAEAIRLVVDGGTWLSRAWQANADPIELAARLRGEDRLGGLSDRELQVFALIGAGHGPKDIAARLAISTKTVEAHREHIRHKLGLKSAADLTETARQWAGSGGA